MKQLNHLEIANNLLQLAGLHLEAWAEHTAQQLKIQEDAAPDDADNIAYMQGRKSNAASSSSLCIDLMQKTWRQLKQEPVYQPEIGLPSNFTVIKSKG